MKRVKVTKNDKVIAFDFDANLLELNKMYRLCELFNLDEIYIDIYGVSNQKNSFISTLVKTNASIMVAQIDNLYGIAIKANLKDIPIIAKVLSEFDFDDMNIWDCYTSWEEYLKDKNTKMPFFTVKPIKIESSGKFYLNYNPNDGQKIEIICDKVYGEQELSVNIADIIST